MSFSTTLCNHHSYTSSNHKDTNREEEPKESLGIVTEIAAIIFLVSLTDFFPFISKHGIDLTDMCQHLCGHPLAFFGKQFLNLMGKILRIASSCIVGTEDVEGYSGCFSLNLSDNSVMRERVSARRTLKGLVVDLRIIHERNNIAKYSIICMFRECFENILPFSEISSYFC